MSRGAQKRGRFKPANAPASPSPAVDLLQERHFDYLCAVPFHKQSELLPSVEEAVNLQPELEVEKQARLQEAQRAEKSERLRITLQQRLTAQTEAELAGLFAGEDRQLRARLPINPRLTQALALLAMDAPASHLEFQLRQSSWLSRELLAEINTPGFRHSSGINQTITDLSHGLACLGKQRLWTLLCRYLCEQMLPDEPRPFATSVRRLWGYLSVRANAAASLAEQQGLDPYLAARLAWNHGYGALALLRLLQQIFLGLCEVHMQQARLASQPQLYQMLSQLDLPATMLKRLLVKYHVLLSQRLLEALSPGCKLSVSSLAELNSRLPWQLISPYSRIVLRADRYAQYVNLNEHRRILPEEAVKVMAQFGFSGDDLLLLQRQNLKKPRL